jgi:pimeloyl-ACP methyl ester carboxylesterase
MRRRETIATVALAGTGAALWGLQLLADRRAIAADPEHELLSDPPRGRELAVRADDGTPLHVELFGEEDAPTIVLVHGWTCSLRFWAYQLRDLAPHARIVAYDLRGHALSGRPANGDYSMQAFAGDLDAVLRATVPAGERPVVAGHSLGGMTIVAWAAAQEGGVANRISAAALVSTGMNDLISESLVLRTPARLNGAQVLAGRLLLSATSPLPKRSTPLSHRAVQYVALAPSASPARVAFCERMVLDTSRDVRGGIGATLSELDIHDGVASLEVPTTVIAGARDRLTPPVHARRMAEALPHLRELVVIPDVGHMTPIEAPERVDEALRALLVGADARATPARRPAVR